MTKRYFKTATIQAEQFDEAKWQSIYNDAHNPEKWDAVARKFGIDHYHNYFIIPTYEDDMRIHDGDWITTGVNGKHWPIADDIFQKTYAELPVIPKAVAEYISAAKNKEVDIEEVNIVRATLAAVDYEQANWIVVDWLQKHGDDFARAWLDGYQVEEGIK